MNSSQVWGGFRVAKRATIVFLLEGEGEVRAIHNGYADIGVKHERIFRKIGDSIVILITYYLLNLCKVLIRLYLVLLCRLSLWRII